MSTAQFASGLSTRADTGAAISEAAGAVRAGLEGRDPDLLLAFVSMDHGAELASISARIQSASGARHLLGCTGESIVGGRLEVEEEPAIALWAVACEDMVVRPFRTRASQDESGAIHFDALPEIRDPRRSTLLLLADPFTFPMPEYLRLLNERAPGVPAIGGMASGGRGPGQNLLFHDGEFARQGALGAVIEGGIELHPIVSQGCRPVGKPYVITKVKGDLLCRLGGQNATSVLAELLQALSPEDRELFQRGPFLGMAVDATKSRFERGDFLVRGIRGHHRGENALAIADTSLRAGQTVQFMVRDPASAGEDLVQLLRRSAGFPASPPQSVGALIFTCNGRGSRMFAGEPHHDIARLQANFGAEIPAAGFFAMGEIGPVGGQNFLHGFTASVGVFRARAD
jgi:small ligand-binding sensory domain FIST